MSPSKPKRKTNFCPYSLLLNNYVIIQCPFKSSAVQSYTIKNISSGPNIHSCPIGCVWAEYLLVKQEPTGFQWWSNTEAVYWVGSGVRPATPLRRAISEHHVIPHVIEVPIWFHWDLETQLINLHSWPTSWARREGRPRPSCGHTVRCPCSPPQACSLPSWALAYRHL